MEIPPAAVFKTPLTDFDAVIVLREEALPYPDRAVLGSTKGLPSQTGGEDADGDEDELSCHKKARARLHSIPKGEPLSSMSSSSSISYVANPVRQNRQLRDICRVWKSQRHTSVTDRLLGARNLLQHFFPAGPTAIYC